jgi:hypothetical protein
MEQTTIKKMLATEEIAARFNELAQQEKWFEIQDELFANNVRSIEPPDSPCFKNAQGKIPVRKNEEDWAREVEEVHGLSTTQSIVGDNHFAVERNGILL